MLDIKFIRENVDLIKEAARKKRIDINIDTLIALDNKRRRMMTTIEEKKARQNAVSELIVRSNDQKEKDDLILEMKAVKGAKELEEASFKELMKDWQSLMLQVPNIPDVSVPEGIDDSENVQVRIWGEMPQFNFLPKDHIDLMLQNKMVDFERGTKTHGFRGYFLMNDGAEISWALWNYARDFFGKKQFTPFIAPSIVKKEFFYGTGHLPKEADDLFNTQDDDFLSGTAEVPMMAYHANEILNENELPKRYLAFSPCYRREAGSHGKDTRGLIRVHEFYKLEQLILCRADHGESEALHEEINRNYEEFIESLNMPYRRLLICGGDLSASKVKQYDTEIWFPSENSYREGSSASYFHDYQTRRFNIRYDENGKKKHVHSLNCTAVATPRLIGAIVENYQQEDGSIKIPEALVPYMMGKKVINGQKKNQENTVI
jgi:seryl-tRNA synthetase